MYIDLYNKSAVKYEFRQILLRIEPMKHSPAAHHKVCKKKRDPNTIYKTNSTTPEQNHSNSETYYQHNTN